MKLEENHVSMIRTKTKVVNNTKTSKMITKRMVKNVAKSEEEEAEEVKTEKAAEVVKTENIKMTIKRLSKRKNTKRSQTDKSLMIQTIPQKRRRKMERETNKEEEVEVVMVAINR